jgi:hypothetical protein
MEQGYDFPLKYTSLYEFRSRSEALYISLGSQNGGQNLKNTAMKKYPTLCVLENRRKMQQQLEELSLFQELLFTSEAIDEQFCGKAHEIAEGLQPWIDALKCKLAQ